MKSFHFSSTLLSFAFALLSASAAISQTFYGTNNYTEYHQGTLPVLITAPHGGSLSPAAIPDRTCNAAVTAPDLQTRELAFQIDTALFQLTGCHAHVVVSNLARIKLDPNRPLASATCGNTLAAITYDEFHNFIDTAETKMVQQHNYGFYADIHGHSHTIQRLELGYLLDESQLALPSSTLNSPAYVNSCSIKHLVNTNSNGSTLSDLLSGPNALGTLLASSGYSSVPSAQDPYPLNGQPYFSGGHDLMVHSSVLNGNIIDAVQIECYNNGIRDTWLNRKKFADTLAKNLLVFINTHYTPGQVCLITTNAEEKKEREFHWKTDHEKREVRINFAIPQKRVIYVYSAQGQKLSEQVCNGHDCLLNFKEWSAGVYLIRANDLLLKVVFD
ncbi:MAG: hypothetical protein K0S12_1960 [Bacteroidetes bacterium]|nr:hypothetical protein [Bacteroidota bacterium]